MNMRKLLSIILVIVWMITVFCFSHQQGEGSGNTSRAITLHIVEILDIHNDIIQEYKEELAQNIEPMIRKLAHLSIYLLGGILIINSISQFVEKDKMSIIYSSIIGIIYAISDEIHQLFIVGRDGKVADVIIDSLGVFIGIAIYLFLKVILNRLKANKVD